METDKLRAILRTKHRAIEAAIGTYFIAGMSVYTLNQIDEDLEFETNFRGTTCKIVIETNEDNQITLDTAF